MAWILMLNPPRERPIAWSSLSFLGAGTMLMGTHDGAVDHRIFVVGIRCEMLKDALPDAGFGPPAEPPVGVLPVTEPFWQVTQGITGSVAIQQRLRRTGDYPSPSPRLNPPTQARDP
jgi:hypothetical protein